MKMLTNSEQLKIHTANVHVQLEQTLIPIIRCISTPAQYADLLKHFYAFYAPIENELSKVAGIEELTAGVELRKAGSLKKDIVALTGNADSLPLCNDLPPCTDLSHAFGVMYVLEGSTLGGKAIASIISKQLLTDSSVPFSFFLYYGDEAKIKWHQFKTRLDSSPEIFQSSLLSAATDTFVLFKNWIDKNSTIVHLDTA